MGSTFASLLFFSFALTFVFVSCEVDSYFFPIESIGDYKDSIATINELLISYSRVNTTEIQLFFAHDKDGLDKKPKVMGEKLFISKPCCSNGNCSICCNGAYYPCCTAAGCRCPAFNEPCL
eukprot:TRINITY_DN568_c0_g1_i3.p1 TRINITY_DN568_c0_g1~~TRINITY_DN568_c0_g1_i3.p1  ORF type:complete len:121 (+),score=24.10 TRINITY_DN568_c0_g1_i3:103-465(+)